MVWVLDPQKYADAADPRALPGAAGHAPRRDAGRAQPHRRGRPPTRRERDARRRAPAAGGRRSRRRARCSRPRPAPARGSTSCAARSASGSPTRPRPATRLAGDIADAAAAAVRRRAATPQPRELGRQGPARAGRRARRRRRRADRRRRRAAGHHDPGPPGDRLAADRVGLPAPARPAAPAAPRPGHQRQGRDRRRALVDAGGATTCRRRAWRPPCATCATTCPKGLAQPWVRSVRQRLDLAVRRPRGPARPGRHHHRARGRPARRPWCRAVRVLQWVLFVAALGGGRVAGGAGRDGLPADAGAGDARLPRLPGARR